MEVSSLCYKVYVFESSCVMEPFDRIIHQIALVKFDKTILIVYESL